MATLNLTERAGQVWVASKRVLRKRWPWIVAGMIVLALAVWLGWLLRTGRLETGFEGYTPPSPGVERAKTVWDWLDLLLVPVFLILAAWLLNRAAKTRELEVEEHRIKEQQAIELDRSRQTLLQTYLDRITVLLREKWRESGQGFVEANILRAQTLTVLRQLDGERKGLLLQFLYDSGLISGPWRGEVGHKAIIVLYQADLSDAELGEAELDNANLFGANLTRANLELANLFRARLQTADLSKAKLRWVCLSEADLTLADLREADIYHAILHSAKLNEAVLVLANLREADLRRANLTQACLVGASMVQANLQEANLAEADMRWADLTGAEVTDEQLAQAKSLEGATMPDGTKHE